MKIFEIINLLLVFLLISCEKYQSEIVDSQELNISIKSIESISSVPLPEAVIVYPNPFGNVVNLYCYGNNNDVVKIIVSHKDGRMKKFESTSPNLILDFSNCPVGVYYCEVLIGNKIYRRQLIKQD
ncbi:hypothetical protein ES705_50205 [subsurface metagenome]